MAKRDLLRRVEQVEAKASALFGLDGKGSAVEQLAKMLEARRLLLDGRKPSEYLEPDADQIADVAARAGATVEQVQTAIRSHNNVLRDFELNY